MRPGTKRKKIAAIRSARCEWKPKPDDRRDSDDAGRLREVDAKEVCSSRGIDDRTRGCVALSDAEINEKEGSEVGALEGPRPEVSESERG